MKCGPRYLFIFLCLIGSELFSQDYGGVGFIDMPSAFMLDDADIKITHSTDYFHEGTAITYQITPFLMGTFRYSGFRSSWIWDRNIEVKARLLRETNFLPEVSLGIRDIGGRQYLGESTSLPQRDITISRQALGLAGEGSLGMEATATR